MLDKVNIANDEIQYNDCIYFIQISIAILDNYFLVCFIQFSLFDSGEGLRRLLARKV